METISNTLFWISNGLLVPVVVLLLLFFLRAIILAGGLNLVNLSGKGNRLLGSHHLVIVGTVVVQIV